MARLKEIVVDSWHPARLAKFWAAVLDEFEVAPYDADENARLAALGRTPDTDPSVCLQGPGLQIYFQEPERQMEFQGRLHLDIVGASRDEEVERLVALGATIAATHAEYTKMRDPEGNEFCVQDPAPTEPEVTTAP